MKSTAEHADGPPSGDTAEPVDQFTNSAAAIGHQPLVTVGVLAIQRHLKKMRKRLKRVIEGEAGEAIHQLRVTSRSLHATLEMLEETPIFDGSQLHRLNRRLGHITQVLGEVRDLDVLLERVENDEREHPVLAAGCEIVRAVLTLRRTIASERLLTELRRKRTRYLLRSLRQLAEHNTAPEAGDTDEHRVVRVRHVAGSQIWRRFEEVLAFETTLSEASWEILHALRKVCKRLRYTLEVLNAAESESDQGVFAVLRATQDHLGRLHDTVVALQLVDEQRGLHPDDAALTAYAELLTRDRDHLRSSFAPLWERLSSDGLRLHLAEFIAAL